ncbi:TD and POZ domain-containing protein 3 [Trichonephila clavata]|uniref:TD and POZ domain-containing protein 3 n=1 Tax=Trichonephila clavata TaxID=2740835 RepID=A0A8X6L0Z9_TRICU|nr:TD and POZ domain-containing protein 3 [Trichonephila clavata]
MASENRKGCTIYWKIKNFSMFWYSALSNLKTPVIIVDELEKTKWQLWLEKASQREDFVTLILHRKEDCEGPVHINLCLEFSVLARDHSELISKNVFKLTFVSDQRICLELEKVKNVLVFKKNEFTWKDVLLMRCKLWVGDPRNAEAVKFFARTGDCIEQRSVTWNVGEFEAIRQGQRSTFLPRTSSEKELVTLDLYTSRASWGLAESVNVECKNFNNSFKFLTFKLYLLQKNGEETRLYDSDDFPEEYITFLHYLLPLKKDELEARCTVDDVLSFRCECTFINELTFSLIEAIDRSPSPAAAESCEKDYLDSRGFWKNDLKFLLEFKPISDAKICTRVRTFPVHKKFLNARSRVIEKKFYDTKIKNCIDIKDVDDETMRRLLLYAYTHTVEDLEWEDTLKLYEAASKYAVLPLKSICSTRLKDFVSPANVTRIFCAAANNRDHDLQKTLRGYMRQLEVSRSRWTSFVEGVLQYIFCKLKR